MHLLQSSFAGFVLATLTGAAHAHMAMSDPTPRGNPFPPVGTADYDLKSPLDSEARPFPCGGKPKGVNVLTTNAGSTVPVTIGGSANHDGGHCQFALSVDGSTFVVVKDVIRDCLIDSNNFKYDVPIPGGFPSGPAVLSWTWINALGNREFYMNCADITVNNGGSGFTGPELLIVNLPGHPTVPEMLAGVDDSRGLFATRPMISVGSGSATTSSTSSTSSSSTQSTAHQLTAPAHVAAAPASAASSDTVAADSTVEPAVSSDSTAAPASVPAPSADTTTSSSSSTSTAPSTSSVDCSSPTAALMTCSGTGFIMCSNGAPSQFMPCAPSTECRPFGKYVQCVPPGFSIAVRK
ncbi:hypothetical protein HDU89_001292 [Geranomyces variabilis]|nr:hypothetical protein HDU89_001292 [Geranomyces variabilis]